MPPIRRRRSWRATSRAATRSTSNGLPAPFDVDRGQRRGRLDDQRAAGQRHLAAQRLLQLLGSAGRLERIRQVLQPLGQPCKGARQGLLEPTARLDQERPVAEHDPLQVGTEVLQQQPPQRLGRGSEQRRRPRGPCPGLDRRPGLAQTQGLVEQLLVGGAHGCRAQAEAAARKQPVGALLLAGLLASRKRRRQQGPVEAWPVYEADPGQGDVGGEPRPLAAPGLTPDLHQDGLAFADLLADPGAARCAGESARVAGAEKGIGAEAAIDERAVEIVRDPAHPAKADGAGRGRGLIGEVDLDQTVVLEQADPHAAGHAVDDQRPAHGSGRQPRPRSRSRVTASGSPTTFDQLPLIAVMNASARPWIA